MCDISLLLIINSETLRFSVVIKKLRNWTDRNYEFFLKTEVKNMPQNGGEGKEYKIFLARFNITTHNMEKIIL
jgi:hypothetical protein